MSDKRLFQIVVKPGARIANSKFPHPLVTMDYDDEGDLIAVSLPGVYAEDLDAIDAASNASPEPKALYPDVDVARTEVNGALENPRGEV